MATESCGLPVEFLEHKQSVRIGRYPYSFGGNSFDKGGSMANVLRMARERAISREVDLVNNLPRESVAAMEVSARQLAVDLDRFLEVACPIWPAERKRYVMARHVSLDPQGLNLTEAQWRMMDWPEWFRLAGIWLEQQGRRVAAFTRTCASLSPGRPRKLETAEILRIWAGRTITSAVLGEIGKQVYRQEWEGSDNVGRNRIRERVRSRLKTQANFEID